MNEASKTRLLWTEEEAALLSGEGIDIGCGPDPVSPTAYGFDMGQGDANHITRHVSRQFDYVFSAHCLEHMHKPAEAILEWWQLVRPGGILFVLVPDEDLYEQGFFPSLFNTDHKATFTLSKRQSWSPCSHNVLDLARSLPGGELVSLQLHDIGYDRSRMSFRRRPSLPQRALRWVHYRLIERKIVIPWLALRVRLIAPVDQTVEGAAAQIQLIVRKRAV